ncbi:10113_t:CDS:2 [Entrophospora sp. SA101]|nr:10113_t:CDS:2 [Entrophospora sp. SA101]CAJ0846856.1 12330_t:CDS:2 [Entrophospora sp. SA101]
MSVNKAKDLSVNLESKTIRVVFIALLLDILAFTIILPLFPRLLEDYREREKGDETTLLSWFLNQISIFKEAIGGSVGNNPKWDLVLLGGALGSLYSFLQFVASPFIGVFSDRHGRRKTLLLTMVIIWLFAKSFGLFVLARVIGGLSEGNVQLSIAIVSDVTTHNSRSKGLVRIAFAISFTLGPAIGAYFASIDLTHSFPTLVDWGLNPYSTPAFVALLLLIIETLYLYLLLPETANIKPNKKKDIKKEINNLTSKDDQKILVSKKLENLKILNWIHFLYLFSFSGMEFTLTFLTYDLFDFSNMQNGMLLGYTGILSAIIQGGYVRRKANKIGEKNIVIQGITSSAIALGIISLLTKINNAIIWLYIEKSEIIKIPKGEALGRFRSSGQLGRSSGPIAACSLYWMAGSEICYATGSNP